MKFVSVFVFILFAFNTHASRMQDGIYQFTMSRGLTPYLEVSEDQVEFNAAGETVEFFKDDLVFVRFLNFGDVEIHLLPEGDEIGFIPEIIYISRDDFEDAALDFLSYGNENTLKDIKEPSRRRRMRYRGASGCVAYVKKKIGWNGPLGDGWKVTSTLRRAGWKPVSCAHAPLGAVASWSGGRHGLGHAAIRERWGWCYDLGCHDPGRRYRLLNCVKRR